MAGSCQSCAMPLKQVTEGGGTEADGSRSAKYCSFCYADGAFLAHDISVAEMQAIGISALKKKSCLALLDG